MSGIPYGQDSPLIGPGERIPFPSGSAEANQLECMKALIEVKGHVEILGETPLAAVLFMVIQADGTAAVECAGDGELLFRGLGKLAASLIDERLDQLEEDDRELTP